jgi:hypothetical protein
VAALATWLHAQLHERGYDLSGPRSGGIGQAATDSGISPATMSRLVRGTRAVNDIDVYRRLSRWLSHPLGDILVRAGQLQPGDLETDQAADGRMTPDQAADGLGLTGHERELFLLNVHALRTPPAD